MKWKANSPYRSKWNSITFGVALHPTPGDKFNHNSFRNFGDQTRGRAFFVHFFASLTNALSQAHLNYTDDRSIETKYNFWNTAFIPINLALVIRKAFFAYMFIVLWTRTRVSTFDSWVTFKFLTHIVRAMIKFNAPLPDSRLELPHSPPSATEVSWHESSAAP